MFFNQKVTFIYADINNKLVSFNYNNDLAYIRSYLSNRGIVTSQYTEERPADIETISDDISFSSGDYIIFYIDTYRNLKLSQGICRKLTSNDFFDSKCVFLFDNEFLKEKNSLSELIDNQFTNSELDLLVNYLNGNTEQNEINQYIYKNDLIPIDEINTVGFQINEYNSLDVIEEELFYVKEKINEIKFLIPLVIKSCENSEQLSQFLARQREVQFHLILSEECIIEEIFNNSQIKKLTLTAKNSIRIDKILRISKQKIKLNFVFCIDSEQTLLECLQSIKKMLNMGINIENICFQDKKKIIINEMLLKLIGEIKKESRIGSLNDPLYNGVLMFYSGMYTSNILDGAVKHIQVNQQLGEEDLRKLSKIVSLNSALISSSTSKSGEDNYRYFLENEEIQLEDSFYANSLKSSNEMDVFSHHHTQKNNKIQLDNYAIQDLYFEAYSKDNKNNATILNLNTKDDLDCFLEDVKYFEQTGGFKHRYQINSKLLDSCRWLGMGGCSVSNVPRLILNQDKSVSPCFNCNKIIGTLNEELFELKENSQMIIEEEKLKRGCATCEVKDICSKCTFLPDYMSSEQYCTIRKKQPILEKYIQSSQVLNFVFNYSNYLNSNSIEIKDIKLSNTYTSQLFKEKRIELDSILINNNIHLLRFKDEFILFDLAKVKLSRINKVLAYILEAFYKGYDGDQLIEIIQRDFSISLEKAREIYEKSNEMYKNLGIIFKKEVV
ncbi:hypothetical protein JDS99_28035 [Bacillus cereus group sp. N6]|uniref:hypothetical protein n=1 Tax=Bacillus cereus group sp. N6 TaxID=2794583 RepID=UPI0018F55D28|nr:hypothetical protein [Bacillus cereus group sp. N6]MBJ8113410.1 hypothetical protein [Bacillus cereus group sp. N6]